MNISNKLIGYKIEQLYSSRDTNGQKKHESILKEVQKLAGEYKAELDMLQRVFSRHRSVLVVYDYDFLEDTRIKVKLYAYEQ